MTGVPFMMVKHLQTMLGIRGLNEIPQKAVAFPLDENVPFLLHGYVKL